jgi:hypothetical protein
MPAFYFEPARNRGLFFAQNFRWLSNGNSDI